MKIRTDFVTNSSSSSFVCFGIYNKELYELLQKYRKEEKLKHKQVYEDHILCYECAWETLNFSDSDNYGIEITDEVRGDYNKSPQTAEKIIEKFLEKLNEQEIQTINSLIKQAFKDKTIQYKRFRGYTDSYDDIFSFGQAPSSIEQIVHKNENNAAEEDALVDLSNTTKRAVWSYKEDGSNENIFVINKDRNEKISIDGLFTKDGDLFSGEIKNVQKFRNHKYSPKGITYGESRYYFLLKDNSIRTVLYKKGKSDIKKNQKMAEWYDGKQNVKDFVEGRYVHYLDGTVELYEEYNNVDFKNALEKNGNNVTKIYSLDYYPPDSYLIEFANGKLVPIGSPAQKLIRKAKKIDRIEYITPPVFIDQEEKPILIMSLGDNTYLADSAYDVFVNVKSIKYDFEFNSGFIILKTDGSVIKTNRLGEKQETIQSAENPVREIEVFCRNDYFKNDIYILLYKNGELYVDGNKVAENVKHIELNFTTLYAYI